jgi:hypothetical protein
MGALKNENGNRAPEELQDCAAYPVAGQQQRPRGEAAEGKAWLAVHNLFYHPPTQRA